jgi:putative FmdB family regulatory protein
LPENRVNKRLYPNANFPICGRLGTPCTEQHINIEVDGCEKGETRRFGKPRGISEDAKMWYACRSCNHEFEDGAAMAAKTTPRCPKCGGQTLEVYDVPLRFKGRYDRNGLPIVE